MFAVLAAKDSYELRRYWRIMQSMKRGSWRGNLSALVEEQAGLVTRQQALDAGVPRRTLDRLTAGEGSFEKVDHGVYRLRGASPPDHLELRAAWLQLAPAEPIWLRSAVEGVVSHRSAADMYGVGHLPEERHDFTVGARHQSRRADVRIHRRKLTEKEWLILRGLPVTRPARIASDLLYDHEDPTGVAHVISDSLRSVYDYPSTVAEALARHAARFGLRRGDGVGLLRTLLELTGDPQTELWLSEARAGGTAGMERAPATVGGYPLR